MAGSALRGSCQKQLLISIEGNIGSGKSTFLESFRTTGAIDIPGEQLSIGNSLHQHGISTEVIPEPVEDWKNVHGANMLKLMYEDPLKHTFLFQNVVLLSDVKRMSANPDAANVRLVERITGSQCFIQQALKKGNLTQLEANILANWSNFITSSQGTPTADATVYLKTSPTVALERIRKRNRPEEVGMGLEYLQELHALHEDHIHDLMLRGHHVIKFDNNGTLDSPAVKSSRGKVVRFLKSYMRNHKWPQVMKHELDCLNGCVLCSEGK